MSSGDLPFVINQMLKCVCVSLDRWGRPVLYQSVHEAYRRRSRGDSGLSIRIYSVVVYASTTRTTIFKKKRPTWQVIYGIAFYIEST